MRSALLNSDNQWEEYRNKQVMKFLFEAIWVRSKTPVNGEQNCMFSAEVLLGLAFHEYYSPAQGNKDVVNYLLSHDGTEISNRNLI